MRHMKPLCTQCGNTYALGRLFAGRTQCTHCEHNENYFHKSKNIYLDNLDLYSIMGYNVISGSTNQYSSY